VSLQGGDKPRGEMGVERGAENRSSSSDQRSWDKPKSGGNERSSLERSNRDGQGAERMDRGTSLANRSSYDREGGSSDGSKRGARLDEKPLPTGGSGLPAHDGVAAGEALVKDAKRRTDAAEAERKQQEQRLKQRRVS
jgi:hypothetical protein